MKLRLTSIKLSRQGKILQLRKARKIRNPRCMSISTAPESKSLGRTNDPTSEKYVYIYTLKGTPTLMEINL